MPANSLYNELNALSETTDDRPVPFATYDDGSAYGPPIIGRYKFLLLRMLKASDLKRDVIEGLHFQKKSYATVIQSLLYRYKNITEFRLDFIQYYSESLDYSSRMTLPSNSDTSWEASMLRFLEYLLTKNLLRPGFLYDYLIQERPEVLESQINGDHLHAYLWGNTRLI